MSKTVELVFRKKVCVDADEITLAGYKNACLTEVAEIEYRIAIQASAEEIRGMTAYVPTSQVIEADVYAENAEGRLEYLPAQLTFSDVAIEHDSENSGEALPEISASDLELGDVSCEVIEIRGRKGLKLRASGRLTVKVA